MRSEARCLEIAAQATGTSIALGEHAVVRLAGIGSRRAGAAAAGLLEDGAGALVSWGIAGGLDPHLQPGSLLLPTRVRTLESGDFAICVPWRERLACGLQPLLPVHGGLLIEVGAVVSTPQAKGRLLESSGAAAVDMESAAVGSMAAEAGVPFLVVRAISDAAATAVPGSALAAVDADGEVRRWRCVLALLRSPGELSALIRLRRESRAAHATLRRVAGCAGPELGYRAAG